MRAVKHLLRVAVAAIFFLAACAEAQAGVAPGYASFRDIPGVTDAEIKAVEAFQKEGRAFVYGAIPSTEAFVVEYGAIKGFSTLVCAWLTELFKIPFTPRLCEWGTLFPGLGSGAIDFTGDITPTVGRRQIYYMTDPIAQHVLKFFRLAGSEPVAEILAERPLRIVLSQDSITLGQVPPAVMHGKYEIFFIKDNADAYAMLKKGEADAFLAEDVLEAAFDVYGDVIAEDVLPVTYGSVSLTTLNPELEPVISIVQKALKDGAIRRLVELHNQGYGEYRKHKLFMRLSGAEREYLLDHPVVPFAAEPSNYPVSFYNGREKEWQGVIFDLLREIEDITGLSFKRVNDESATWPVLLRMLESGEASLISELIRSPERLGQFLWPETDTLRDNYALLSKADLGNVGVNEIAYMKVGVNKDTANAELFRSWFPDHMYTVEYESSDAAVAALDRGEVDMVMASLCQLLALTNYEERTGYKANFVFDRALNSTFGFNKNEAVLCSIVDKALRMIDTKGIVGQWMRKTYDYRAKLEQARRPWIIGAAVFVCGFFLLALFAYSKHQERLQLKKEVNSRTLEVEDQRTLMSVINQAALLLLESDAEDYQGALDRSMEKVCLSLQADRVYLWRNVRKEDGLYYRQVCKWTGEDTRMDERLWEFSYRDTLPIWEEMLGRGEVLNGPLDTIPEGDKAFFAAYRMQSLLVVPLFLKDAFWGFVSFDDCRRRRVFPEAEEYALRSWGLLAVGVIQRGEIARSMRRTLTELEAVTSNYKGAIWSVNDEGVITTFKGQYLQTIGMEPAFLEGKKLEADLLKSRHFDMIENVARTFLEGPQDWISEIDGGVFHSYTMPMFDGRGEVIGVVGSTDDVTRTSRLQWELEAAVEDAKIANHAKSVFLATMSHEIRTPMNAILGITEIQLQNAALSPDMREAFSRIYNSGKLLLNLINDLLDMSKIEAGKLELVSAEYDTASMLNDTAQLNILRIGSKPVEFELRVDENTPAAMVGDVLRVRQILNNLLSNAFKYTEQGLVRLSVFSEHRPEHRPGQISSDPVGDEADVTLVFTVSDTGPGMTAEQLSRLFDRYSRFNQEANRKTEGAGLGMSITRDLVRLMNGEIVVESEPGAGTTVTVRLRQRRVGAESLGREMAENLRRFRMGGEAQTTTIRLDREPMPYGRVLVVDDVETNRYVAKGILEPYGLAVDMAESGFEAIEKIRQGKVYDIVFMDHIMPGMDGIEATHIMRGLGYTRPVVALTANAVQGQAEMFRERGFDDFISKPIDIRQMNAVLNAFIRDRQQPEVLAAARRQGRGHAAPESPPEASPEVFIDARLAKIFARDAARSVAALEALREELREFGDEALRNGIIHAHGMKSALANIGEKDLSAVAAGLEQAGRNNDRAALEAQIPAFARALREVIARLTPEAEDAGNDGDGGMTVPDEEEDRAYVREKLLALKTACLVYDKKAARGVLNEMRRKTWPRPVEDLLETLSRHLLHSEFKEIARAVDKEAHS